MAENRGIWRLIGEHLFLHGQKLLIQQGVAHCGQCLLNGCFGVGNLVELDVRLGLPAAHKKAYAPAMEKGWVGKVDPAVRANQTFAGQNLGQKPTHHLRRGPTAAGYRRWGAVRSRKIRIYKCWRNKTIS